MEENECQKCGIDVELAEKCDDCGQTFCSAHIDSHKETCLTDTEFERPDEISNRTVEDSSNVFGVSEEDTRQQIMNKNLKSDDLPVPLIRGITGTFTIVFIGTFIVQWLLFPFVLGYGPTSETWMSTFTLRETHLLYVWTWFTSMFSHGGIIHLIVNLVVFFSFGIALEKILGERRFSVLFLVGGLIAGLAQMVLITVFPAQQEIALLGASGGISAMIGFMTALWPESKIYLFFIIPMKIWIGTSLLVVISIAIIILFGPAAFGIAHTAHLGGIAFGLAYAHIILRTDILE